RRLWRSQAFEEATSSLEAPSLSRSGPTSPSPALQNLPLTSCSATSTSGKRRTWSQKFLIEGPDKASPNKKITRTGGPANSQDLETRVPTLPKNLSPKQGKPQSPGVPGLTHPLHEVPSQNWLWESECEQMEREEPVLSIMEVPDASGDRRQDIPCKTYTLSPETGPSLLWRTQEPGDQEKHQNLALASDELLKPT
ncbi:Microtubule-associated serine/threonine-protein kinase 2, partial [Microtus ochrogaster]